ncbi:MAG: hypothetical protein MUE82_02780, partial [Chloroflexi bacterium]|nr:hypothetical protein [Chloroflexota bacterium]
AKEPERWEAVRGMYVIDRGESKPPLLYWIDGTRLWTTPLEAVAGTAPSSGAGSASPQTEGASEAPAETIVSP